ncbi:flavodoxin family protein [Flammeovirga agarivorans]|uniref:NAD(P)H-dependent oxidoreductase n=1 Tax=Flammeovirga agarivorans TaxID=2726742 RepID=A0A7X8SHG6_9BACT|nr:NAD(P)H-dependent oxidoreductase [Flammeovirga agarivorans]NLR90188.1 NAD(P)H-dependent oxidoreductase [Flammeovirga agarivorans]
MKGVIILGSANSKGNTYTLLKTINKDLDFDVVDLNDYNIQPFDYEFKNREDDFYNLISKMIEYDIIVLATPVYWYTMSGILKMFLDRFSDCLMIYKEIGRQLRGKSLSVISTGSDNVLKEGFYMPFEETAKYLGMSWKDGIYFSSDKLSQLDSHHSRIHSYCKAIKKGNQ